MWSPAARRRRLLTALLPALLCSHLTVGCQRQPLLYDVAVEPSAITPDMDGADDVARIRYGIGAPARLSITLVGDDGQAYRFRDALTRSAGTYEALFGGVVDGRMLPDGRYGLRVEAVPRDEPDADGQTNVLELSILGGDKDPPEMVGFSVQPDTFTPNQDGLGDRVAISYRLDEPAEVRVWLEREDGGYVTDILEDIEAADRPGEVGPHVYDFDAGVDADAPPPPDGDYVIVGRARDAAGNVSEQRLPLSIQDGGQPRVALLGDVDWSDTVLPLGATLSFTVTVANMGLTPIRTRGPEPGFVYDNNATFNQTAPPEFIVLARDGDRASSARVRAVGGSAARADLDLAAAEGKNPPGRVFFSPNTPVTATERLTICGTVRDGDRTAVGAEVFAFEADGDNGLSAVADDRGGFCFPDLIVTPPHERTYARSPGAIRLGLEYDEVRTDLGYPYRWQLGRTAELSVCRADDRLYLCLAPGQSVTITGGVRFVERPFRRSTRAYLSLMHEDVRRMQGPYGQQRITIEY